MSTNGRSTIHLNEPGASIEALDGVPAELLREIRTVELNRQRRSIISEREALIIRYRVCTRIGAEAKELAELLKAVEQCEIGLHEIEVIEQEWGLTQPEV